MNDLIIRIDKAIEENWDASGDPDRTAKAAARVILEAMQEWVSKEHKALQEHCVSTFGLVGVDRQKSDRLKMIGAFAKENGITIACVPVP